MACYRITSPTQQRDLAAAVAVLADGAGFPLLVDLRPGLVIIDSGKDQWHDEAHGLELDFIDLAENIQTAARDLGAAADPGLPRFAQDFLDAADVAAVRAFWVSPHSDTSTTGAPTSLTSTVRDDSTPCWRSKNSTPRTPSGAAGNRIHVELAVPSDLARIRLATTLAGGGRLLDEAEGR